MSLDTLAPTEQLLMRDLKGSICDRLLRDQRFQSLSLSSYPNFRGGVRVNIQVWPRDHIYIYALPWMRGWSVFVSDSDEGKVHDWREVSETFPDLTRSLPCPRGVVGPWHITVDEIVDTILEFKQIIDTHSQQLRDEYVRENWHRGVLWYFAKFNGNNLSFAHDLPYKMWPASAAKLKKLPTR